MLHVDSGLHRDGHGHLPQRGHLMHTLMAALVEAHIDGGVAGGVRVDLVQAVQAEAHVRAV